MAFRRDVQKQMKSIGIHDYVVDFALTEERAWVIEINPFLETTDGALFSWQKEREILENGPLTLRFREKKMQGGKALLANAWRDLIDIPVNLD